MNRRAFLILLLLTCGVLLIGCADLGAGKQSEEELYNQLTESDKMLYNNLLLKVAGRFEDINSLEITSIRESRDTEAENQLYYISLVHSSEQGESETLFYGYGVVDGYQLLVPITFKSDPTEWDFAKESQYDVEKINDTLHAHASTIDALRTPSDFSLSEIENKILNCRTFFYRNGGIQDNHVITRVDLENGNFEFTTFTSKGSSLSDRVSEFSEEGSYSIEVTPDNIAYLVLDGQERCLIQFDEDGNVVGIMATGYKNYEGDVATITLTLTDTW